jgi:hypothetical protein
MSYLYHGLKEIIMKRMVLNLPFCEENPLIAFKFLACFV